MSNKLWFPGFHQVMVRRNQNYLHSLFVGITMPFMNGPSLLWHSLILPIFLGIVALFKVIVIVPFLGGFGMLSTENVSFKHASRRATMRQIIAWAEKVSNDE